MKKSIFLIILILLASACTMETTVQKEKKEPMISCIDSDGGYEPGRKGTLTKYINGDKSVSEDKCKNPTALVEVYCEDNIAKTKEITCRYGCREGECLAQAEEAETEEQPEKDTEEQYNQTRMEKKLEETQQKQEEKREQEKESVQDEFYNCFNGFKDTFETDVDCGGLCAKGCGFGKACKEDSDCAPGLFCNVRSKKCSNLRH